MVNDFKTIPEMLNKVCSKFQSNKEAFSYKEKGSFISINYDQLLQKVKHLAIGLLDLGIHKGDRVGIISENSIEWIISSLAINCIGAIDVPIFPVLTAKQANYIFSETEVSAVFVSNEQQLQKIIKIKPKIQSMSHVILMNGVYNDKHLYIKTLDEIITRTKVLFDMAQINKYWRRANKSILEEDILTIIFTSGTTGNPKGVMLTHKNVCVNAIDSMRIYGDFTGKNSLSFLPLCHSFERTTGFYGLFSHGAHIALSQSVGTVASDMNEIKPHLITTVPRLLETVRKKILSSIDKEKPAKKAIINSAIKTGVRYAKAKQKGTVPFLLTQQYKIAYKAILSQIAAKLGGNLSMCISGGAPIADEVCYFFIALGIEIYQGYGLTEASPVVSANGYNDNKVGSIGKPLAHVKVRLTKEGEILVKGDSVMKGYWKDEEATDMAIDENGWLYTGDIGEILPSGHIRITDRKKFIFVNTGGKNIAPAPIEGLLSQSRYIEHCVLIGDKRDFNTALITPNFDALRELAKSFEIDHADDNILISQPLIIKHMRKELDYYQKDIAPFEKVRKFHMLSTPFSVDSGELSPKLSVKRHVIEKNYSDFIENMYVQGINKNK